MHHDPCFNLFILHDNSFDNQGSEINKNNIFLRFDIRLRLLQNLSLKRSVNKIFCVSVRSIDKRVTNFEE